MWHGHKQSWQLLTHSEVTAGVEIMICTWLQCMEGIYHNETLPQLKEGQYDSFTMIPLLLSLCSSIKFTVKLCSCTSDCGEQSCCTGPQVRISGQEYELTMMEPLQKLYHKQVTAAAVFVCPALWRNNHATHFYSYSCGWPQGQQLM